MSTSVGTVLRSVEDLLSPEKHEATRSEAIPTKLLVILLVWMHTGKAYRTDNGAWVESAVPGLLQVIHSWYYQEIRENISLTQSVIGLVEYNKCVLGFALCVLVEGRLVFTVLRMIFRSSGVSNRILQA